MSAGCHRLLREHREECVLVTDARDVEEEIGPVGLADGGPTRAVPAAQNPRADLPAVVRALLEAMPARGTVGVSVLAARIGQRPRDVLAMLGPLALEGLVEAQPHGYRLTALGRAPAARPDQPTSSCPPSTGGRQLAIPPTGDDSRALADDDGPRPPTAKEHP
jgi:DNA processing protein